MASSQTGKHSSANRVGSIVVILLLGLWGSWQAWSASSPFGAGPASSGSPTEYVLLACSLLCLYAAALIGGWWVSRMRPLAPGARPPMSILVGAVTLYGSIATAIFAWSTASEWSLAAALPLGLMAYVHVHMAGSLHGEAGAGRGDAEVPAGSGTV